MRELYNENRLMRFCGTCGWLLVLAGVVTFSLLPGTLEAKLAELAAGICPQRPAHSFFLSGVQMPMEARMTGIFAGFFATVLASWTLGEAKAVGMPSKRQFAILVSLIGLMAADGLNATASDLNLGSLYPPSNALRLATGLLAGLATGLLFLPVCNAMAWGEKAASLDKPIMNIFLLVLLLLMMVMPIAGWSWAYYPLAIASIAGLIVIMAVLNLILVLKLIRMRWPIRGVLDLGHYAALTLGLAMVELIALAALRHAILP